MIAATSPLTYHLGAYQTNYLSKPGNFAGKELDVARNLNSWYFLSRLDVSAPASTGAIIAFGDSITDGTASVANSNHRWPDLLAARLAKDKAANATAMLNEAIAGNRLLSEWMVPFGINALARFDRDVLALPGTKYMVVLEGINDIGAGRTGPAPSAEELIAAHQQLIKRAHDHGLKIIGATLTPFEGAAYFHRRRRSGSARQSTTGCAPAKVPIPTMASSISIRLRVTPQNPTKFEPHLRFRRSPPSQQRGL